MASIPRTVFSRTSRVLPRTTAISSFQQHRTYAFPAQYQTGDKQTAIVTGSARGMYVYSPMAVYQQYIACSSCT